MMETGIIDAARALLRKHFGHTEFRSGQADAIEALLQGRDVLAIMPTGAGKSLCYQIPSLMLSGITLVISPLISLMQDQVESLRQAGIPAAFINSSMSSSEYVFVMQEARRGAYALIYIAPERLNADSFQRFAAEVPIAMIAVDEAHCVSQWGQDFRQSYLEIARFVEQLPTRPVIGAFTATATQQVSDDITQLLKLKTPIRITTGFDRKNLYFSVQKPQNKKQALIDLLRKYTGKSGIVYCLSRRLVEEITEELCDNGILATRYHAGLSAEERAANQEDFLYDRKTVMIATNAFGMGIDKSNVSFVIHYNMPKDVESYYQEAGRAGRDGSPAECTLLYSGSDVRLNTFLIEQSREAADITDETLRQSLIAKSKERLHAMTIYATTSNCLRQYMLRYFGETAPVFCGCCSSCRVETEELDVTMESIKIISCVYRGRQNHYHLSRSMTAAILTGSKKQNLLNMRLDKLSTYGILKESSAAAVMQIIDYLISKGDLALHYLEEKKYDELVLTSGSAEIIRKERTVYMTVPKHKNQKAKGDTFLSEKDSDIDETLYQQLSELRADYAKKEKIPPYMVFSNATIRDMCRRMPQNIPQFMNVSGIGVMRAQKYGKAFLEVIKAYRKKSV